MSKTKLIVAVFIAALSASSLASASASAAPAEWMLNKKTLSEEGLTSAALATTAKVDKPVVLGGISGLSIECKGQLEGIEPVLHAGNTTTAGSLIFTNCSTSNPSCIVSKIETAAVTGELTLDGALAIKGVVRSTTGTVIITLNITGAECLIAGKKPLTGDFEVLAPEGQDERTDQALTFNQGATGLLKFGSSSATLTGSALLLLANKAAWSFL